MWARGSRLRWGVLAGGLVRTEGVLQFAEHLDIALVVAGADGGTR